MYAAVPSRRAQTAASRGHNCGLCAHPSSGRAGEHAPAVRAGVADRLEWMGVKMDHAMNALRAEGEWKLSREDSPVQIYVIPTDEEFMIASDVERLVGAAK